MLSDTMAFGRDVAMAKEVRDRGKEGGVGEHRKNSVLFPQAIKTRPRSRPMSGADSASEPATMDDDGGR